jgi:hypothetical protein
MIMQIRFMLFNLSGLLDDPLDARRICKRSSKLPRQSGHDYSLRRESLSSVANTLLRSRDDIARRGLVDPAR